MNLGLKLALPALTLPIAGGAEAALIMTLEGGISHEMPAVNRLVQGSELGVRFGVDQAVTFKATDRLNRPTNSFFGLTSNWNFGGAGPEPDWNGHPPFLATGLYDGVVSFTFDNPVAAVLGRWNWNYDGNTVLRIFGTNENLLESVTLGASSMRAPGYYGFKQSGNVIKRIEFAGFNIGARDLSTLSVSAAVPEPSAWAMMILGFGTVGWSMRSARRKMDFRPARA